MTHDPSSENQHIPVRNNRLKRDMFPVFVGFHRDQLPEFVVFFTMVSLGDPVILGQELLA